MPIVFHFTQVSNGSNYLRSLLTIQDTDIPISNTERETVENLIRTELIHDQRYQQSLNAHNNDLHPRLEELVPLPNTETTASPSSLSMQAIERYENENVEENEDVHIIEGVDMDRYLGFTDSSDEANVKYYESLYYAINESNNLSTMSQNIEEFANVNQQYLEQLDQIQNQLSSNLDKKRKNIEQVNILRKKRQNDFKPVNDYLNERWKDGLKSVIDLSVESLSKAD